MPIYHIGVLSSTASIAPFPKEIYEAFDTDIKQAKTTDKKWNVKILATILEPAKVGYVSHYTGAIISVKKGKNDTIEFFDSSNFTKSKMWAPYTHKYIKEYANKRKFKFIKEFPKCQYASAGPFCQTWSLVWLQAKICHINTVEYFRHKNRKMTKKQGQDFILDKFENFFSILSTEIKKEYNKSSKKNQTPKLPKNFSVSKYFSYIKKKDPQMLLEEN